VFVKLKIKTDLNNGFLKRFVLFSFQGSTFKSENTFIIISQYRF
jgi:hypothetical protein